MSYIVPLADELAIAASDAGGMGTILCLLIGAGLQAPTGLLIWSAAYGALIDEYGLQASIDSKFSGPDYADLDHGQRQTADPTLRR
ncbi:hypothetical protein [Arthrobacter bambusae]|uniref:hypothetical protein n=1 Tax=Arthrobacter bambusae TaxID=1338426 RepID=UPI002786454E|nr:hypothetical protein [Arthrobacter bambusae]MDQ0242132.1 phosphoenolpyruvate synthase/pyruvate phosphate dikinase [Arthrobacter bambusae]